MEALERFVSENVELKQLEDLIAPFNIFEVLGATWHEVHHSNFLAYLLDPSQNHGLGAAFAKRFLAKAISQAPRESRPISLVDLDIWELSDLEVRREWQNIDVFLISREANLAVIIENKLLSGEHSDQLARYWTEIGLRHPSMQRMGVFLNRSGEPRQPRALPLRRL